MKFENDKNPDGGELWFLHDGLNILMDQATDGTPWASYNQGIGIDKLVSVVEWTGQSAPRTRYYHADAIGSVRSLTDEGAGQVGTYAYDAWGNVTASSGAEANEYKFTSRRWDSAGGLQYNRARFYDPAIGRFISPDPLTGGPDDPTISYFGGLYSAFHRFLREYVDALQPDKLNRYTYCYNNPVNYIDPLGLWEVEEDGEDSGEAINREGVIYAKTHGDSVIDLARQFGLSRKEVRDLLGLKPGQNIIEDDIWIQLSKLFPGSIQNALRKQSEAEEHGRYSTEQLHKGDITISENIARFYRIPLSALGVTEEQLYNCWGRAADVLELRSPDRVGKYMGQWEANALLSSVTVSKLETIIQPQCGDLLRHGTSHAPSDLQHFSTHLGKDSNGKDWVFSKEGRGGQDKMSSLDRLTTGPIGRSYGPADYVDTYRVELIYRVLFRFVWVVRRNEVCRLPGKRSFSNSSVL